MHSDAIELISAFNLIIGIQDITSRRTKFYKVLRKEQYLEMKELRMLKKCFITKKKSKKMWF